MGIRQAVLDDLNIVRHISEVTISEIYPHYYPKGAVDFFLEHHSEENILRDIKRNQVFLCFDYAQDAVGTITINVWGVHLISTIRISICRMYKREEY